MEGGGRLAGKEGVCRSVREDKRGQQGEVDHKTLCACVKSSKRKDFKFDATKM